MPMHIEEMSSEVTVFEGDLPLSEKQTEVLVRKVMARLAEDEKARRQRSAATELRSGATPRLDVR